MLLCYCVTVLLRQSLLCFTFSSSSFRILSHVLSFLLKCIYVRVRTTPPPLQTYFDLYIDENS